MTGGDPHTVEGRRELEARSPLFKADQVKVNYIRHNEISLYKT